MSSAERTDGTLPTLGGQAVVEGVMIRAPNGIAVCVRNPDGEIVCRTERVKGSSLRGVPVVRGIVTLGESLSLGMRAMLWSAQVATGREPEEPGEGQVRATIVASMGFAAGLFMLAPAVVASRLQGRRRGGRMGTLVESVLRVGTLIGYLRAVGRMPQAQRLFAYHGAEHRAIQAYEAGQPLEVESLRNFPNAHVRCGTSFLLTTTLVSAFVYAAIGAQSLRSKLISRLVLTPLIAGLSYEAIRIGAAAQGGVGRLLFRPNLALQALTTRDPDEPQMEVALEAVRAALADHEMS